MGEISNILQGAKVPIIRGRSILAQQIAMGQSFIQVFDKNAFRNSGGLDSKSGNRSGTSNTPLQNEGKKNVNVNISGPSTTILDEKDSVWGRGWGDKEDPNNARINILGYDAKAEVSGSVNNKGVQGKASLNTGAYALDANGQFAYGPLSMGADAFLGVKNDTEASANFNPLNGTGALSFSNTTFAGGRAGLDYGLGIGPVSFTNENEITYGASNKATAELNFNAGQGKIDWKAENSFSPLGIGLETKPNLTIGPVELSAGALDFSLRPTLTVGVEGNVRHGVISNDFYAKTELGKFELKDPKATIDGIPVKYVVEDKIEDFRAWIGGEDKYSGPLSPGWDGNSGTNFGGGLGWDGSTGAEKGTGFGGELGFSGETKPNQGTYTGAGSLGWDGNSDKNSGEGTGVGSGSGTGSGTQSGGSSGATQGGSQGDGSRGGSGTGTGTSSGTQSGGSSGATQGGSQGDGSRGGSGTGSGSGTQSGGSSGATSGGSQGDGSRGGSGTTDSSGSSGGSSSGGGANSGTGSETSPSPH